MNKTAATVAFLGCLAIGSDRALADEEAAVPSWGDIQELLDHFENKEVREAFLEKYGLTAERIIEDEMRHAPDRSRRRRTRNVEYTRLGFPVSVTTDAMLFSGESVDGEGPVGGGYEERVQFVILMVGTAPPRGRGKSPLAYTDKLPYGILRSHTPEDAVEVVPGPFRKDIDESGSGTIDFMMGLRTVTPVRLFFSGGKLTSLVVGPDPKKKYKAMKRVPPPSDGGGADEPARDAKGR